MYRFCKRILGIVLAVSMLAGMSGCGIVDWLWKKDNLFDQDVDRDQLAYEAEYVAQHLDYVSKGEYHTITLVSGGLPAEIAKNYEDAWLNLVNGTWQVISGSVKIAGQGDLELENEYELLVAELMQTTGSDENFAAGFEKEYIDALLSMLNGINEQLKSAKDATDFFTGESLDKVENLTTYLDTVIIAAQELAGTDKKQQIKLFEDAFKTVKEEFGETYLKDNKDFIANVKNSMGLAINVTANTVESIEDMMDKYLFYQAVYGASAQWESVWRDIAAEARNADTDEGKKIAKCIDKLLDEIRSYRQDSADAMAAAGVSCSGDNLAEFAYKMGYGFFDKWVSKHPLVGLIRGGFIAGVALANMIVNSDDIAYYGQMMVGYGRISEYAFEAMRDAEKYMLLRESYSSAVKFDAAFHIYKAIQRSAADCAINYSYAIIDNPVGYIFKSTTEDELRDIEYLQKFKAEWAGKVCHGDSKVINNGGLFVGYRDNVYYLRRPEGFVGDTATLGVFSGNYELPADLVCRNSDGTEEVLLSGCYGDNIYICGNKIILRDTQGDLYVSNLDGSDVTKVCQGWVADDIPEMGMLLYYSGDDEAFIASDMGENSFVVTEDPVTPVQVLDNAFYYYRENNSVYSFEMYQFDDRKVTPLGDIDISEEAEPHWYGSIQQMCMTPDGVYVLAGWHAGTGFIYQGGSIFYLSATTGEVTTLVNLDIQVPMFTLVQEKDARKIYFNKMSMYSDVGAFTAATTKENSCLDLQTMKVSDADIPLCENDRVFINDGEVLIYRDYAPEPTVILAEETANALGYRGIGELSDGYVMYAKTVDFIGSDAYVTLFEMVPDEDSTIGWRQGYARVSTVVYKVDLETQETERIYSY